MEREAAGEAAADRCFYTSKQREPCEAFGTGPAPIGSWQTRSTFAQVVPEDGGRAGPLSGVRPGRDGRRNVGHGST